MFLFIANSLQIASGKDPELTLVESLEELRRSGRSLLDFDKSISDFCEESYFTVSAYF